MDGAIAGLNLLLQHSNELIETITNSALEEYQDAGRRFAPRGRVGDSTAPPGELAASILIDEPRGGAGVYAGRVGPTTVYARQVELGGHIYPGRIARSIGAFDHLEGTGNQPGKYFLVFERYGHKIVTQHVYEKPQPYMLPALMFAQFAVEATINEQVTYFVETGSVNQLF